MPTVFDPVDLGGKTLPNRVVMAPMSRSRAPSACPTASTATYYRQRASAGLIITEGVQPSPVAHGYPDTPGLYADEQVTAWREVTDAVHRANGTIFAQLMHAGRIGHPSLLPDGLIPVGPSPVTADVQVFTSRGPRACVPPHVLTEPEIESTIGDFTRAARNAMDAGFDGVELHGGNGFLIHQFLSDNANTRTDGWGRTVEGRTRFAVEAARAVADAIGPDRVGFQVSPGNPLNDVVEHDVTTTYLALAAALDELELAYLAVVESPDRDLTARLRVEWRGVLILNPYTGARPTGPQEIDLVAEGVADMISFGALFLANPDLPRRLAVGGPYNSPDPSTFYGGGARGYTDYPFLDQDAG